MCAWTSKHQEKYLEKATCLVNARGYHGEDQAVHGYQIFYVLKKGVKSL